MEQDEPHLHFRGFSLWIRGYDCSACDPSKNFWGANRLVVEAELQTASSHVVLKTSACLNTNELKGFLLRLESERGIATSSQDWQVVLSSAEDEIDWCINSRGGSLFFEIKLDVSFAPVFEKHIVMWEMTAAELDIVISQLKSIVSTFPVRGEQP